MLGIFFSIEMSDWEEEITCQYFIKNKEPPATAFNQETFYKVKKLYDSLLWIPRKWALELISEKVEDNADK